MSSATKILGKWQSAPSNDPDVMVGAAIIGSPVGRRFTLVIDAGSGWITAARLNNEEVAHVATELIDRLATQIEHARIGGVENGWGQGTSHPGVEWITATSGDRSLAFPDRLALGMARLWIVPSTDGETFGLLAPGAAVTELGLFDSEETALRTAHVIDVLAQEHDQTTRS